MMFITISSLLTHDGHLNWLPLLFFQKSFKFIGTSDFEKCSAKVADLFNVEVCKSKYSQLCFDSSIIPPKDQPFVVIFFFIKKKFYKAYNLCIKLSLQWNIPCRSWEILMANFLFFQGISGFAYIMNNIKLPEPLNERNVSQLLKKSCRSTWEELGESMEQISKKFLSEFCLRSRYAFYLLTQVYQFTGPKWQDVTFMTQVISNVCI